MNISQNISQPRPIPVQVLLTRQATQAGVSFSLDDEQQEVPPLLLFSSAWAQPLVSAYARVLAMLSLGNDAAILFPCEFKPNAAAPLGFVCREKPIDGSAAGILRAAIVSRAAQEALGFSLFDADRKRVDFMRVVRQCETIGTLPWQALRCDSDEAWRELASRLTIDIRPPVGEDVAEDALQAAKD